MNVLEDKVAVVTGSAQGLGTCIALTFARAGAHIVLLDRFTDPLEVIEKEIVRLGRKALSLEVDIANLGSVEACARKAQEEFGRIDILVNNAAIGGPSAPLWEVDPAAWRECLDINTTGVFHCCRAFLPGMIGQGSGSVIIIGSMTGKRVLENRTAYATSKLALVGMARTLAWEVGRYGIRVNVVSPGPMEGERLKWVFETQAQQEGIPVEAARKRMADASPLGQFVPPENVAQAALFLASDLSGSTTGEDFNCSAGICMH
jgi:NAD(P)-dependent dehydrogenase (short-subunit alcohol dehydrogenase family)